MNLGKLLKYTPFGWTFSFLKKAKGLFGNLNSGVQNLLKGVTGSGLTDAQKEANAFTAEQTQKQMDFQQQMRDTQYQATVADMKAAGINPALAMNNSINAAPSGASGSSTQPSNGDLVGLLGQIANLSLLNAQRKNINADTQEKVANAARADSERILNELRGENQKLVNERYPKLFDTTIRQMESAISESYSNVMINDYKADNLQASTALIKTQEYVEYLKSKWIDKLSAAKERGDLASAAASFAEAAYKGYITNYAKEHGGVLPGPNQALGIGAALASVLSDIGMSDVELDSLDWKDLMWPWFSFFRKKNKK